MTPQQQEITELVKALLDKLDEVVPKNVLHWAVESLRTDSLSYLHVAHTVKTHDTVEGPNKAE